MSFEHKTSIKKPNNLNRNKKEMAHKVVGIFQSASQAKEAAEFLDQNGTHKIEIHQSKEDQEVDANTEDTSEMNTFFENLIKSGKEGPIEGYSERGNSMVMVYAENEREASNAAEILYEYGAVEVYEEDNKEGSSKI
jgi:hypothetical protein